MSTATIVILTDHATVRGEEWGLAIDFAPALDTDSVWGFVNEHTETDRDAYALVVLEKDWDAAALSGRPYMDVDVPDTQAARLDEWMA
jgi:hypothetical protein